jgi:hypothetical protein
LEADPAALQFDFCTSGNRVKLNHCSISHHGPSGAWARRECSISFFCCEVTDCGANGIMIGEGQTRLVGGKPWWQESPHQASDNCSVWDCDVAHCGRELYGAVGIWVGLAEGVLIRKSRIHDLPYTGVSLGWMWWNPRDRASPRQTPCRRNRIEGNNIHDCMQILSDGGGIYCLGLQPESTIAWNEIYNIPLNAGRAESNGMFLDQGTGGFEIHNNLIYAIDKSPLRFHKGWENLLRDNVMVPGKDIPPIRYNDTVKERIERKDNITPAIIEEAKQIWEEQRQRRYGNTER